MLYEINKKKILFIHIPRTGGRHVHQIMLANNINSVFHTLKEFIEIFDDKNVLELENGFRHSTVEDKKNFLGFLPKNIFSVIRNPVDRFTSMTINKKNIDYAMKFKEMVNYDQFEYCMENSKYGAIFPNGVEKTVKGLKNRFVAQSNYINENVKLWKFEKGFEEKYYNWLSNTFNIKLDINNKVFKYKIINDYDEKINIRYCGKVKENIERYYAKDMELWESLKNVGD